MRFKRDLKPCPENLKPLEKLLEVNRPKLYAALEEYNIIHHGGYLNENTFLPLKGTVTELLFTLKIKQMLHTGRQSKGYDVTFENIKISFKGIGTSELSDEHVLQNFRRKKTQLGEFDVVLFVGAQTKFREAFICAADRKTIKEHSYSNDSKMMVKGLEYGDMFFYDSKLQDIDESFCGDDILEKVVSFIMKLVKVKQNEKNKRTRVTR